MIHVSQLQDYPLFSGLSEDVLAGLAERLVRRTLAKDAYLYYPGNPGLSMYLVESGLVRQFFCDSNGNEFLLNLVGPRSSISLPFLNDKQVRPTGAAAQVQTIVLCLSREDLFYFMDRSSELMHNVYTDLTNSLIKLMMHSRMLASANLNERLAAILLYMSRTAQGPWPANGSRDEFILPMSQTDLAGWLGASRGRLNRVLNDFEKLGLVRLDGQRLQILDRPQLERIAEGLTLSSL
jgi:CRP/FNR family transcriptional regulator